jgi:2'-phosphotransferase
MERQHVHFATGLPKSGGVVSGMRKSADAIIELDLPAAMEAGLKFYRSVNGVILCPGDDAGYVRPEFLKPISKAQALKR